VKLDKKICFHFSFRYGRGSKFSRLLKTVVDVLFLGLSHQARNTIVIGEVSGRCGGQ
jgi:hypothetical protein